MTPWARPEHRKDPDMTMTPSATRRSLRPKLVPLGVALGAAPVLALLTLAGCSADGTSPAPTRSSAVSMAPAGALVAEPVTVREYERHITTLADAEVMQGRLPGTEGIERAAQYIERHFRTLGLQPAFPAMSGGDGAVVIDGNKSFRQPFDVPGGARVLEESVRVTGRDGSTRRLIAGEEFNALGYGGSADVSGPLAFVGYSVEEGPDGYSSYGDVDDLTGAIAMIVRFEPFGEDGRSLWSGTPGWTGFAGLAGKFGAAIERNASAIVLVNPPGADDPRIGELMTAQSTGWGRAMTEIPVVQVTPEGADLLIAAASGQQATLAELLTQANSSGGTTVFDMGTVSITTEIDRSDISTDNVGAILPGKGDLADEWVVIGAHYDHVGYGPYGTRRPGEMHPGADDNASGTSAVMTVASLLKREYGAMGDADARSVLFLLFTAEESGLIGSRYYADHPVVAHEDTHVMINIDMVGTYGDGQGLEIGALSSGDRLPMVFGPVLDASGLDIRQDSGIGTGRSDHANFDRKGVPNVFLFTGITDEYHTPDDTLDTIDIPGAALIAKLASRLALAAATDEGEIAHVTRDTGRQTIGGPTAVRVRVGIAPDSYGGNDGVMVGRVYEGTSAELGGVKEGDRIIRWGEQEVTTVESWMPMLGAHQPGDEVEIIVVRDGEEVTLTLELQARRQDG